MTTATLPASMTADEFYDWANRPENAGELYELDNGKVVVVLSPGELHGLICFLICRILGDYVVRRRGYLLTNDAGIVLGPKTVRGPDISLFMTPISIEQVSKKHSRRKPELVVEVFSPTDRPGRLLKRINQYLKAGIPLVWVVYPEDRTVNVYRTNEFPIVLEEGDTLKGNGVLPGFHCKVSEFFTLPGASGDE